MFPTIKQFSKRSAILVAHISSKHGGPGSGTVNISSRAAVLGSAGESVDYAASKAALDALTIGLSKEKASFSTGTFIDVSGGR